MAIVVTYGTFDLFHVGHVRLLKRAAALGHELHVGISSDEFNTIKGKKSVLPYEQRAEIVSAIKYVTSVFPENHWKQKVEDIKRLKADMFVMGNDWAGKFDELKEHCDVTYLERTDGISTTELKQALSAFESDKMKSFREGLDAIQHIVAQLS